MNTDKIIFDWNYADNIVYKLLGITCEPTIIKSQESASYFFEIPDDIGEGNVELLVINNLLSATIFNGKWKKSRTYHVADKNRVRLVFGLDLNISMGHSDAKEPIKLSKQSWQLINFSRDSVDQEVIEKNAKTVWISLAIDREYIKSLLSNTNAKETSEILKIFKKSKTKFTEKEFPLDHTLNLIVSNILSMNVPDSLRLCYAQSKINELICVAIDRMIHHKPTSKLPVKLRKSDEIAIKLAKSIILENLHQLPSLRDIALMVGINRNKLYYGFKYYFHLSIKEFIKQERLAKAYTLLVETERSLIDISIESGFSHQSSLSTAFKNHYGITPTVFRKNINLDA